MVPVSSWTKSGIFREGWQGQVQCAWVLAACGAPLQQHLLGAGSLAGFSNSWTGCMGKRSGQVLNEICLFPCSSEHYIPQLSSFRAGWYNQVQLAGGSPLPVQGAGQMFVVPI